MAGFPTSALAQKIKPKVREYAKVHGISQDSLRFWVDTNFVKLQMDHVASGGIPKDSITGYRLPLTDSARDSIRIPMDSLRIKRAVDDDHELNQKDRKKKEKKNDLNKDAIKDE